MISKERGMAPFKGIRADRFPMWYGGAPETTENIKRLLGVETEGQALYDIIGIDYKQFDQFISVNLLKNSKMEQLKMNGVSEEEDIIGVRL